MKIWRFHEFGDIKNLQLEEAPNPEPGPGEALLRMEYAALNPADRFLVEGMYPGPGKPPFAVGRDGCGVVEKSAGKFQPGDRVVVMRSELGVRRDGTLAQFTTVPEESLAPLPAGWSPDEGAAGPLVFLTAWQALVDEGRLQSGQTVLITGASGGVGTASLLLAKAMGAKVIALSRSPEKRMQLEALGADWTFDSADPDLPMTVRRVTKAEPVHVAVENLGGPFLQHCLNITCANACISVVGLLAGLKSEITIAPILFKRQRIVGIFVGAYTASEATGAWAKIVEALDSAAMRPLVDRVFPFTQVQEAFAHMAAGPMGKVLVQVG